MKTWTMIAVALVAYEIASGYLVAALAADMFSQIVAPVLSALIH